MIALAGANMTTQRARDLQARGAVAIARFGVSWRPVFAGGETDRTLSFDGEGALASDSGYCRAEAIALAVLYLNAVGHTRIGLIQAGPVDVVRAICARQRAGGLEVIDAGEGAQLSVLVAQNPPVTAVVCGSDCRALQVLRLCALKDIAVPRTLAIVGYGDTAVARSARPALTSLRVPAAQAGAMIASQLAAPAGARALPAALSAKLVVRDSSAAPARAGGSGST
ncbi:MAG TPA: substrate-binding domain-containing protein [Casimicrobiaceae bacterium]